MINPGLEVGGRGFNHQCRLKSVLDHSNDCLTVEIINQTEAVYAVWPDEDVGAAGILASEPLDRFFYLPDRPRLAKEHATAGSQNADVEVIARHRCELSSDLATGDDAAHQ